MGRLEKHIKQVRGIAYKNDEISDIPMEDFVPVLKANNITEDGLKTDDLIYIHQDRIRPEQFIRKGDLLLAASSGSRKIVGKNIYFDSNFEGSFGAFCKLIRPKNSVYAPFLKHFFQTHNYKRHIEGLIQGANINNLRNEHIDSLNLPELTKNNQIRIAEVLSRVERLIAKRKESINLLDELLKSTFLEMFGDPVGNEKDWPKLKLNEVCTKITDGTHHSPPITQKGVPYVTAKHVKEYSIEFWNNPWFISEKDHKQIFSRCNPERGDVLYIKDGVTTGIAAINDYDFEFSMLSSLALLKPNSDVCLESYLCAWLNNPLVKSRMISNMAGGAIKRLTLTKINSLPINLPPLEVQARFKSIFEKVQVLKSKLARSRDELENLYGSLSQRAFKGELDLSKLEIGHIIPVSQGGTDDEENLQAVSSKDNRRISDKPKTTRVGNAIMENFYEEDIVKLLKEHFGSFDFRFSEVIEFFENEKAVALNYLTSEELKRHRNQLEQDIKTFIFSCVEGKNPHLKLEQKFVNAFEESELKSLNPRAGRDSILAELNSRPPIIELEDISGIYFRIMK